MLLSDEDCRKRLRKVRTVTNAKGKSKMTLFIDSKVRPSVVAAAGKNTKILYLLSNGYAKWGTHKHVRVLFKFLKKKAILSIGRDLSGWVFTDVDMKDTEILELIEAIGKKVAPNWKFKMAMKPARHIKLSKRALTELGDEDSSEDEDDSQSESEDDDGSDDPSSNEKNSESDDDAPKKDDKKKRGLVVLSDDEVPSTVKKSKKSKADGELAVSATPSYLPCSLPSFLASDLCLLCSSKTTSTMMK